MKVKCESDVAQSCPTFSDPVDCSLPGSSIHGIFQARVLEWGAIAFSNIKCTNIQIIGVPEEEGKKKGYEKIFEEILVENFPNMEKEIVNQVQEAQRLLYRINPRRNTPRHILIKLTKTKHKERILKAAREKQQVTYKGNPLRLTADLSTETLQARREW